MAPAHPHGGTPAHPHDPTPALRTALLAAVCIFTAAGFIYLTLPEVPWGPVTGTGQDEWYNVVRSLRALYEYLHPSYFIHPALYYELLAFTFGVERIVLSLSGALTDASFLDYYLANQAQFSDLARCVSIGCGALVVVAAVWLGAMLSSVSGGLLTGLVVLSLPLMRALSTTIRVDALALATYVIAAAMIVRWHQRYTERSFVAACVAIGVAASANYPGAMLLLVLAWLEWARPATARGEPRTRRILRACIIAFVVFLLLNPYVLLDFPVFIRWFLFQAEVPLYKHPHAPAPTPWGYALVLRDQGPAAVAACIAGAFAFFRPRAPAGALAIFAAAHLIGFSLMQTQYNRFVLPAITLLCIVGPAWVCVLMARRGGVFAATVLTLTACALVVASMVIRTAPPLQTDADYRAAMFDWVLTNVAPTSHLIIESDTLPLVQTVYDPVDRGVRFQAALRDAFERRYPDFPRDVHKAQFIAAVYNYDPQLFERDDSFFLASSQSREFITANRDLLPDPVRFYEALDARAHAVHETGGFREKLILYRARETDPAVQLPPATSTTPLPAQRSRRSKPRARPRS